ncbi:MAG: DsbA family protein [Deltaproteobacteria bacterium]|nr:DsbA family protein [Deltaproteobacteria bacterium]
MAEVRLRDIKEEFGDQVALEYRSFMLRPEPDPTVTFNDYRRTNWQRATREEPRTQFRLWESEESYPKCSVPALEAAACARLQGEEAFERFHFLVFRTLFTDNRDISDAKVLREVAEKGALDMPRFVQDFESHRLQGQVIEEYHEAVQRFGVTAIPTVLVNGKKLVGAVPAEEYRKAILRTL